PDADHYLGHVPKALVAEAVRDVHGKDAAAKVAAMKAGPAAAEAAKLLAGTRWLPKALRGDGYTHAKPGKAPAKKAAKKAGSKPAAKTAPAGKPAKKATKRVAKAAAE